MTRALVLWALLCGAVQAQIGPSLGSPTGPGIGTTLPSAIRSPDDAAPWWRSGPLIDADGNAVAHVYWRNGAIVDALGNSWTMNGTVPQVGAAGAVPPGAGPFAVANNYTLGTGSDALDFAGNAWTFAAVGRLTSLPASTAPVIVNATLNTEGWLVQMSSTGTAAIVCYNGTGNSNPTANAISAGSVFVVCGGHTAAGSSLIKLNSGSTSTAVAGHTAGSTSVATLGLLASLSRAFPGTLFEFYATTTEPSDVICTGIVNTVAARMKVSL